MSKTRSKATSRPDSRGSKRSPGVLRKRALRVQQCEGVPPLYQFSLTGEELHQIADISRITRDEQGEVIGYQRAGVKKHVDGIAAYIDSERPLMPNPIVLALTAHTKFVGSRGPHVSDGHGSAGTIEIPIPGERQPRPAWIVDGQQRSLALAKASRQGFAMPVVAFVAETVELQREQFLLINNSRPLPRGLVTELLPEVDTTLPPNLAQNRIPSKLCEFLHVHPDSPFCGLIRRPSMSREDSRKAVIQDTSIVEMLRISLNNVSGCLCSYRNLATGTMEIEGVLATLNTYWGAVRDVFPDAWGRPSRESRLMGGVGISAMGRLMDKVMAFVDPYSPDAMDGVRADLELIAPHCAWTEGEWVKLDGRAWNELSNTPTHKRLLANHLVRSFMERKRAT